MRVDILQTKTPSGQELLSINLPSDFAASSRLSINHLPQVVAGVPASSYLKALDTNLSPLPA